MPGPSRHTTHPAILLSLGAVLVLALTLGVTGCGNDPDPVTPPATEPTSTPEPGPAEPAEDTVFEVYLVRGEHLGVGVREVPATTAVAEAALEELLGGPSSQEAEAELATEIPEGTRLLGVAVEDGVATVDLSGEFESGGGSLSMQLRVAQVVFTLTQFESVDRVAFMIDGVSVEAIGGEGLMVDPPVSRLDLADNTAPAILVESPAPWQIVASPLRVRGMSNTFEATLRYEVVDPRGLIVEEGFATATSGSGTWGTFDFTVPFEISYEGVGQLIVFEESAEDGSRINLVEIPLNMSEE